MDVDKLKNLLADVTVVGRKEGNNGGAAEIRSVDGLKPQSAVSRKDSARKKASGALTGSQKVLFKKKESVPSPRGDENSLQEFLSAKSYLMNDSRGKIKHMVFQYSASAPELAQELLKAYGSIIDNMSDDVKFTFLVSDKDRHREIENIVLKNKRNPERFETIETSTEISIWTRDSMLPADTGENNVIMLPNRQLSGFYLDVERGAARKMEDQQRLSSFRTQELNDIYIDGGDILSGPAGIFVGQDSVNKTIQGLKERSKSDPNFRFYITNYYEQRTGKKVTENVVKDGLREVTFDESLREVVPLMLESKFQNKLYIIGQDDPSTERVETQPVFHIDMCVTPINEKTVLLGDPRMAFDTLEKLRNENPAEYEKQLDAFCNSSGRTKDSCKEWLGESAKKFQENEKNNNFEAVRKYLETQGFNVIRIPYLTGSAHTMPYMTYNNCLMNDYVEKDGKRVKQVFLPTYGLRALDDEAVKVYNKLGYEVIPLDFNETAKLQGALRCISQVLEKSP